MNTSTSMSTLQYRLASGLGCACVALVVGNVTLATLNKGLQADVSLRQQFVQQSVQLEGLYREIVRALAELGARNQDNDVKALLERHGISYQVNAPAAPTTGAAPRK